MSLLELILIFVLQFEGMNGQNFVYKTPGQDVTLSCSSLSSADSTCFNITWFFSTGPSNTSSVVQRGKFEKNSSQSARLSLKSDCSLVIKNITAEDAGCYTCRLREDADSDMNTSLSVLTVSSFSPDADPNRGDEVILKCSLWRYSGLGPCNQNSIRWVNEKGTVLFGKGLEYEFLGQTNCVSYLKVKHQSGNNKTFTCQVVKQSKVEIKAEYTPVSLDIKEEDQTEKSDTVSTNQPLGAIMWTLRVTALILMIVITVFLIRHKGFRKPADEKNVNFNGDEVTYENEEAGPAASTRH